MSVELEDPLNISVSYVCHLGFSLRHSVTMNFTAIETSESMHRKPINTELTYGGCIITRNYNSHCGLYEGVDLAL